MPRPDLDELIHLFYDSREPLGRFAPVPSEELPPAYRQLLAHDAHMTVTVEAYHGSPVDVRVLESQLTGEHYARRIVLTTQSSGKRVLFGLVRLDFQYISPEVRREIESRRTPLGRVLIQHNVLRQVELVQLWQIAPGPDLRAQLAIPAGVSTVYGRTALIHCNGQPAVELLEVVVD